jgi:glyoxylate/hydroxypyruvate reductase A
MPDMVCLCGRLDLKALFQEAFEAWTDIRLLNPEEVEDPSSIRAALSFAPRPADFDAFPTLELVCSVGAGVDGLLRHPGLRENMMVVRLLNPNQPKMIAGYVAYHVVGWHRQMWDYPELQQQKVWQWRDMSDPSGFPVAVLGFGTMGEAIARTLTDCGYPVTGWASRARKVDGIDVLSGTDGLDVLLDRSRAVVCILPLTDQTRGILSAPFFARMRSDAVLIQIGRGAHLNEADLLSALDEGRPGLAVLDVTDPEPTPVDSPLWAHPKVRLTPHMSSFNSGEAVARAVQASMNSYLAGQAPTGLVDRKRGY